MSGLLFYTIDFDHKEMIRQLKNYVFSRLIAQINIKIVSKNSFKVLKTNARHRIICFRLPIQRLMKCDIQHKSKIRHIVEIHWNDCRFTVEIIATSLSLHRINYIFIQKNRQNVVEDAKTPFGHIIATSDWPLWDNGNIMRFQRKCQERG